MKKKWDGVERRKSLRVQAEEMVALFYPANQANKSPDNLLHELLVHKVELELQIEELRLSYTLMEEMRNRYLELFEFAPIAFLTTDQDGLIEEVNRSCVELFGTDRSKLINQRFSKLVAVEDQDSWHVFTLGLLAIPMGEKQTCILLLKREDGVCFNANLECSCRETVGSELKLQIALIEIPKIQMIEQLQTVLA